MTSASSSYSDLHRQVEELLPFYVNGTLDGADFELVEQHLESCVACRVELEQENRILHCFAAAEEFPRPDHARAFSELVDRIDDRSMGAAGWWRRTQRLLDRALGAATPFQGARGESRLRFALPLAALMLLATVSVIDEPRLFDTLTDPDSIVAPSAQIVIRFEEGVSLEEVQRILRSVEGQMTSGPDESGWYEVRIGSVESPAPRSALREVADRLKALDAVDFAGVVGTDR